MVEEIKRKMATSINRENILWTNQVFIRSQNSNVTYDEDMNKLTKKLHNQQSVNYIHPKVNYEHLKERDYMHYFMTQAVIRY